MRRFKLLAAILAVVMLIFCACEEIFDISELVSDEDTNINQLITRTYSNDQLKEMIIFTSLKQINEEYPVECLRRTESGYRAVYKGEKTLTLIEFDENGLRTNSNSYNIIEDPGDFDGLEVGDSIRNVRELDPAGDYAFLYTGDTSLPRVSTHYLDTGYAFIITYNSGNIITSIEKWML